MRTARWMLLVASVMFIASIWFLIAGARAAPPEAEVTPAGPALKPVATVLQIMNGIVTPTSQAIYDAVSTTVSASGIVEKAPSNDAEWQAVGSAAASLIESGSLLLLEGRAPDRENWTKFTVMMQEGATAALKATQAKDKEALLASGETINNACDQCHELYQR